MGRIRLVKAAGRTIELQGLRGFAAGPAHRDPNGLGVVGSMVMRFNLLLTPDAVPIAKIKNIKLSFVHASPSFCSYAKLRVMKNRLGADFLWRLPTAQ
jgi:hypothetical protein